MQVRHNRNYIRVRSYTYTRTFEYLLRNIRTTERPGMVKKSLLNRKPKVLRIIQKKFLKPPANRGVLL